MKANYIRARLADGTCATFRGVFAADMEISDNTHEWMRSIRSCGRMDDSIHAPEPEITITIKGRLIERRIYPDGVMFTLREQR